MSYLDGVRERRRRLAEAFVARGTPSLWTLSAFVERGMSGDDATAVVERVLGSLRGGPFEVLPAMLLYCRWAERLPPAASRLVRRFFTEGVLERGNTENHWLMYYAGNLLAAECFGEEAALWNGLPPAAVHGEAKRWILGMIRRTATMGHHEYDSPGYMAEHVVPLAGLAVHAADEEVRTMAAKVLTLLYADMALEYFHGAWVGGHSREGYRQNTWTHVGPVQGLFYLYFEEEFDPERHLQGFTCPLTAMDYAPPEIVIRLGRERPYPAVVKKTKAPRSIYRHVDRPAAPVRKYTYLSRSFALGSTQLGLPGAPAAPIDLVSWDLSWPAEKQHGIIVAAHPYADPGRFSAFLSCLPQMAERAIGTDKPYLQYPDRLFGASPYERMVQHEGTIIVGYRIPPTDRRPYVNLFLPKALAYHEAAGWIAADAGGFYVALYPVGLYRWLEIREATRAHLLVREADLVDGWLVRIDSLKAGLVLEATESSAFASFEAFIDARAAALPDVSRWQTDGVLAASSTAGTRLELDYDGMHRIDGEPVDYDAYPLYQAPGVAAAMGEGIIRFEHGEEELVVDFEIEPDGPVLPMRSIG